MKLKRFFCIALVLILAMGTLAGCGGTTSAKPDASTEKTDTSTPEQVEPTIKPGTTIKMWTFLDPYAQANGRAVALAQMMEEFEKEYGVTVVVEPQDWATLGSKFMAAVASGTAPDIIWTNIDTDLGAVLKMDVLEPLENLFLNEWTDEQFEDAGGVWFELGKDDAGQHYQLSFSRNFNGIVYRTDIFEEAGYEVPFKNWDEFREAAKALTVEKDPLTGTKRYGFGTSLATASSDPILTTATLLDQYGTMFNDDGTAAWANDAGVKGSNLIRDMMLEDGSISETCLSQSVDDLYKDFCAGKYAMVAGAAVRVESCKSSCVFDPDTIAIMPFPGDNNEFSPTVLTGWAVGVWNGSANKYAAGKFLEFMAKPENDALWVSIGGQLPMNKSTIDLLPDTFENESNAYILDSMEYMEEAGWAVPAISMSDYRNDFTAAMQDIIVNGTDTMTALQKVETAFNERNLG